MLYKKNNFIKTIFSMSFFLASLPVQVAHWVPEPLTLHQAEIPSTFYPHYHLQPEMIASIECYPEGSAPCPYCPAFFTSKQELYSHISELADTLSFVFDNNTLDDLPPDPLELEAFKDLPVTADQQLMDNNKIHTKELASRKDQPFNALTNQQTFTDEDLPLPDLGMLPSDFFETLASDLCAQLRPEISAHPFNTPLVHKPKEVLHRPITYSELQAMGLHLKKGKMAPCPFCEEKYNTFKNFIRHMRRNWVDKSFYCQKCNIFQVSAELFEKHQTTPHHLSRKDSTTHKHPRKLFANATTIASQSRKHQQLHYKDTDFIKEYLHGKALQPTHLIPIKCIFCDFEANSLAELERHLERELGKRPYTCTNCHKDYIKHGDLRNHLENMHSAEK